MGSGPVALVSFSEEQETAEISTWAQRKDPVRTVERQSSATQRDLTRNQF